MEYNRSSQFNRGRCVSHPKYNYVIIEDESEILCEELPTEEGKENRAAHHIEEHDKDAMKKERVQA
jgi:hypothetical protein